MATYRSEILNEIRINCHISLLCCGNFDGGANIANIALKLFSFMCFLVLVELRFFYRRLSREKNIKDNNNNNRKEKNKLLLLLLLLLSLLQLLANTMAIIICRLFASRSSSAPRPVAKSLIRYLRLRHSSTSETRQTCSSTESTESTQLGFDCHSPPQTIRNPVL